MKKSILLLGGSLLLAFISYAQHEHHMPMKETAKPQAARVDTAMQMQDHSGVTTHDHSTMNAEMDMGTMSHAFSLNLPMSRNGSGTGWLPDASPMYGYMFHTPKWMYMVHGNVFLRYNNQDVSN